MTPFRTIVASVAAVLIPVSAALAAAPENDKPKGAITRPKFDPAAEKVELFEGIEQEKLDVEVIAKDAYGGNILVENKTKEPLTVVVPPGVVGVHVLEQFNLGGPMGGGGGLLGGCGGIGGQQGSQGQQNQPFGGGMMGGGMMGGGGMGMGGMGGGMGGGFFSIPPEKVVRLPYKSVCLAHGKPDPHPRCTYKLVRVEEFTDNKALQELIRLVGTGRIDQQIAQAAAWHLADEMSWHELAAKSVNRLGGVGPQPYFSYAELYRANQLVVLAAARAKERDEKREVEPQPIVRRRR